jgi:ribosomal protein S18 acetylase RimI-like enzyme
MSAAIALEFGLARSGEAGALARMCRDMIEQGLGWRWQIGAIRSLINDPDTVVLCARRRMAPRAPLDLGANTHAPATQVAGFGVMHYEMERAHLMLLAVQPNLRRHGIGAHLLHWLERTAVTAGVERISLEVRALNTGARQFYRELGYQEREYLPRYYSGLESAFRMERVLRPPAPRTA